MKNVSFIFTLKPNDSLANPIKLGAQGKTQLTGRSVEHDENSVEIKQNEERKQRRACNYLFCLLTGHVYSRAGCHAGRELTAMMITV